MKRKANIVRKKETDLVVNNNGGGEKQTQGRKEKGTRREIKRNYLKDDEEGDENVRGKEMDKTINKKGEEEAWSQPSMLLAVYSLVVYSLFLPVQFLSEYQV